MGSLNDFSEILRDVGIKNNETVVITDAFQKSFRNVSGIVSKARGFVPVTVGEIEKSLAGSLDAVNAAKVSDAIHDGAAVAVSMEKENLSGETKRQSLAKQLSALGYDAPKIFARSVLSGIEIMGNFFRNARKTFSGKTSSPAKIAGGCMKRKIACLTLALLLFAPSVGRVASEKGVARLLHKGEQSVAARETAESFGRKALGIFGVNSAEALDLGDVIGTIVYGMSRANYRTRSLEYQISSLGNLDAGYVIAGILLDALANRTSGTTRAPESAQKEERKQGGGVGEEIAVQEQARLKATVDRLSERGDKDTLKLLTVVMERDKEIRTGKLQAFIDEGVSVENVTYRMHADKDVLHFFKLFAGVTEDHKKTAIVQVFEFMGIDDIHMPNRNEVFR